MRPRLEARRAAGAGLAVAVLAAMVAVSAAAGQRRVDRDRGDRLAATSVQGASMAAPATAATAEPAAGTAAGAGLAGTGGTTPTSVSAQAAGAIAHAANPGGPNVYDPGVTDNQILVGGSTFLSGAAAVYGDQLAAGIQAAFNVINAAGGVNGRQLKLVLYDDGADPARELANTKRLVEVDKVFAMSMIYAPGELGSYIDQHGVPVFTEGQFNEEFSNPWWFGTGGPQRGGSIAMAAKAAAQGAKKAAIFYLNAGGGNYTDAYAATVAKDFQSYGIQVAFTESVKPDQSDCTDGMTKASTGGVDFIDFELDVGHIIPCVLSAQEMNYKPAKGWGGYLIGVPATPQGIGAYSNGMWAVDAFAPIYADPTYLKAIHDVNPSVEAISSPTAGMYTAGFLLAAGLQKLGNDITRVRLRDVLNTFTDWTPPFVPAADVQSHQAPLYTFRPDCHVGLGGFYYIQVRQTSSGHYDFAQASPYQPGIVDGPASSDPLLTCRSREP